MTAGKPTYGISASHGGPRATTRPSPRRCWASLNALSVRRQGGFSLLEVVVAFAILALSLGLLTQIFSRAMNTTALSGDYSRATTLAEARLNAVGIDIPLEPGNYSGEPEDDLSWEVIIERYEPSDVTWEPALDTFFVTSVISWGDEVDKRRQIRLSSLRFADSPDLSGLASEQLLPAREKLPIDAAEGSREQRKGLSDGDPRK